ncbi:MAG: hypothetical protein QXO71_04855 [Candidatus Jordarchaeaceae archaeon]
MENKVKKKEGDITKTFDPLIPEDCINALLSGYTSNAEECIFFSKSVPSKCFLDPFSRRLWDCNGKCFVDGYRCEYIGNSFSLKNSELYSFIYLIGQGGMKIILNLGWSILSEEEVLAVSGISGEDAVFIIHVLKLLDLISQKDGKFMLTSLGRKIHDYLLTRIL